MKIVSRLFVNVVIPIIISIFLIELVGLFSNHNSYFWDHRYLYYSQNAVRGLGPGFWTYAPNSPVRTIAAYELPKDNIWVEYDCKFSTNEFGLIDSGFDPAKPADWLVLGDSFTEGQGGCPWLTQEGLQQRGINKNVINGGIQGAGIKAFELLLNFLEKQVEIKNVLVVAISNDFKRLPHTADPWSGERKCVTEMLCGKKNYVHFVPLGISQDEIIQRTKRRYRVRHQDKYNFFDALEYYSMTYHIFRKFKKIFIKEEEKKVRHSKKNPVKRPFTENYQALLKIKEKYPDLKLLLIPQRDEVGIPKKNNKDTIRVKKWLTKKEIEYFDCDLSIRDYLPIDGHPTVDGYKKIFSCVSEIIK